MHLRKKHTTLSENKEIKFGKKGFIPLRYRFILTTSMMLLLLFSILAAVLVSIQTRTIRSRIEKHGMAISKNIASISVDHLIAYDYIALEKLVNQVINHLDIVKVIIYDKEGKVAGYSGRPDLQNRKLIDTISISAIKTEELLAIVHTPETKKYSVMNVIVPVFLESPKTRWGTVRVCLSLEYMEKQIHQTILSIAGLGFMFLVIGILISNWAARRITRPLEKLTDATVEAAKGNFNQEISIYTNDEVELLGSNFSMMIKEIIVQKQQIRDQLKKIYQNQRLADLGTLAAGMAHEIRNPLSSIKTYVALLPKKIEKPGFLEKFGIIVPREINRLNLLTEELLDFSRPPDYHFKLINVGKLLEQDINLFEAEFNKNFIKCQWDISENLPEIMADANQLNKVFINLMRNAAQAMPDGGNLTIDTSFKENMIIINFRDTGHGFPPELAKKIFDPFFTTKIKGTGLGLAITKKVVSEHGGRLEAKNMKDQGCCFTVNLPEKYPE